MANSYSGVYSSNYSGLFRFIPEFISDIPMFSNVKNVKGLRRIWSLDRKKKTTKCLNSDHGTQKTRLFRDFGRMKTRLFRVFYAILQPKNATARGFCAVLEPKSRLACRFCYKFLLRNIISIGKMGKKKRLFRFNLDIPVYSGPEYLPLPDEWAVGILAKWVRGFSAEKNVG